MRICWHKTLFSTHSLTLSHTSVLMQCDVVFVVFWIVIRKVTFNVCTTCTDTDFSQIIERKERTKENWLNRVVKDHGLSSWLYMVWIYSSVLFKCVTAYLWIYRQKCIHTKIFVTHSHFLVFVCLVGWRNHIWLFERDSGDWHVIIWRVDFCYWSTN